MDEEDLCAVVLLYANKPASSIGDEETKLVLARIWRWIGELVVTVVRATKQEHSKADNRHRFSAANELEGNEDWCMSRALSYVQAEIQRAGRI